ncbi:MAG TPA: DUF899 family protein [Steroidobacteraceae bacterium]|nr:DUF899 family protein [Steroidobacteraceae bacterium]
MTTAPSIGTREDWLHARIALLEAEKDLTRRSDELARRRRELPWVPVVKEHRFETDEGLVALPELFEGQTTQEDRRRTRPDGGGPPAPRPGRRLQ